MRTRFASLIICVVVLINCASREKLSPIGLDADYCPQLDSSNSTLAIKTSVVRVNVFLETSGSMAGYMPNSQPATEFQKLIPDILSILNTEYNQAVKFYSIFNSETSYRTLDLSDARNKILHGEFNWSGSTYLPVMLDSINQYLKDDVVNIFISDVIYSPENDDQKVAVLAATDIREKFSPYVGSYSVFTFCMFSEFRHRDGNSVKSPYYLIIQGKSKNIRKIIKLVSETAYRNNQLYEDINFGLDYDQPYYSILPYSEITLNFTAEPCELFKNAFVKISGISLSEGDSLSFWLGIDLNDFPDYVTNQLYLKQNLSLAIDGGVCKITSIQNKPPNELAADDKSIAARCTHFVRIKITELTSPVSILSLSLKYSRPEWVSRLNENNLAYENRREKTFGLERIISGYEQAYKSNGDSYFFRKLNIPLIEN